MSHMAGSYRTNSIQKQGSGSGSMTYKDPWSQEDIQDKRASGCFQYIQFSGDRKDRVRMLKLVGDFSLIWKTKGHSLVAAAAAKSL